MRVAIHQPNYLPYLGFFDKMRKSDTFVILDDAQFTTGDYHHRNKIRIFNGWKWLTLPVIKKKIEIKEIEIKSDVKISKKDWREYHFKEIKDNYRKTPYFGKYENEIQNIYDTEYNKLIVINMRIIRFLMKSLNINTKLVYASEFGFKSSSNQKLIDIIQTLGGDIYLSGDGARNYLDISLFGNIKVEFQNYKHPIYPQLYKGFVPYMAAIDALFNLGKMPI